MSDIRVCSIDDVEPGAVGAVAADVDGKVHPLALIHSVKGNWFAMDDRCSHGRFKLSEGWVEDETIECTRHGSVFDLVTGKPLNPPASSPVATYPVRIDGTDVFVTID